MHSKSLITRKSIPFIALSDVNSNSIEFELEEHEPTAPSMPYFQYKINYSETDAQIEYKEKCLNVNRATTDSTVAIDQFDDYFILNESEVNKLLRPKQLIQPVDACLVKTRIQWVPDIDNNPGDSFYVKYRIRGEKEYLQTALIANEDFVIIDQFNACRNYELLLVAVDGNFETESEVQETPAIMFMTIH